MGRLPIYLHREQKYFLSTSYKVMFSFFQAQEKLVPAPGRKTRYNQLAKRLSGHGAWPHYMVVRSPYLRFESFFRDKFRKYPLNANPRKPKDRWQMVHYLLLERLGVNHIPDSETIRRALLNTSFKEAVRLLPSIYTKDAHLHPQHWHQRLQVHRIRFMARFDRILHMENPEDMHFMQHCMGLNKLGKVNTSGDFGEPLVWDPASRAIINKVYRDDFRHFDYSMIES